MDGCCQNLPNPARRLQGNRQICERCAIFELKLTTTTSTGQDEEQVTSPLCSRRVPQDAPQQEFPPSGRRIQEPALLDPPQSRLVPHHPRIHHHDPRKGQGCPAIRRAHNNTRQELHGAERPERASRWISLCKPFPQRKIG